MGTWNHTFSSDQTICEHEWAKFQAVLCYTLRKLTDSQKTCPPLEEHRQIVHPDSAETETINRMQPNPLTHYLTNTSFKQLTAILAMHHLQRAAKDTKVNLIEQVHLFLTNVNTLTTIITQLDTDSKDALHRLLAADGALPVHTFEARYGPIRTYKPWRTMPRQRNQAAG